MCPAVTGDSLIIHHQHSHLLAEIGPHLLHLLPPEAAGGGQQLVDILAVLAKNICSCGKKYLLMWQKIFHCNISPRCRAAAAPPWWAPSLWGGRWRGWCRHTDLARVTTFIRRTTECSLTLCCVDTVAAPRIHSITLMLSPKPGHSRPPLCPFLHENTTCKEHNVTRVTCDLNQLTMKTRGGLASLAPMSSQCCRYWPKL